MVAKCDHLSKLRFSKTLPLAFTEHGALMAASVLSSPPAIEASVLIVRTFAQLRSILTANNDLKRRFRKMERSLLEHDHQIAQILELVRQLADPEIPPRRRIGFTPAD